MRMRCVSKGNNRKPVWEWRVESVGVFAIKSRKIGRNQRERRREKKERELLQRREEEERKKKVEREAESCSSGGERAEWKGEFFPQQSTFSCLEQSRLPRQTDFLERRSLVFVPSPHCPFLCLSVYLSFYLTIYLQSSSLFTFFLSSWPFPFSRSPPPPFPWSSPCHSLLKLSPVGSKAIIR